MLRLPLDELPEKKLRKTIKCLRHKEEALEERLLQTTGKGARRRLRRKIDLLRTQRMRCADSLRCTVALHENGQAVVHPSAGSVVFLADQAAASQHRVN